MRITRGKVHEYLGMTLDFLTPGEIQVTMVDFLKGVLEDLQEVITGRSIISSANHMFQVSREDKQTLLNKEQEIALHRTVAQMLFVMSSARKDIKMDISILCT